MTKRALSLILALILLFSALPLTALSAYAEDAELGDTAAQADELAETGADTDTANAGAEPEFTTVNVDSHYDLRSALRAEGNIRINITGDIEKDLRGSYQVGSLQNDFLFTDRATGLEMAYIVEGKKVLELNGHKLNYTTDTPGYASHVFGYNCIFYISSGAELTVNDNTNSGSILFAFRSNLDDYYNNETLYNDFWGLGTRIVMYVAEGGKLTVNGGEIEGGNSQKIWVNDYFHYNGYAYRQCSGVAIRSYGETVINGGTFIGRGSYDGTLDVYGRINVNDGEFWGRGGADVLSIKGDEDSSVKGGSYNVTIPDYPEAHQYANGNYFTEDFVIGKIGIPASAIDANHTQVHVDGQPNLTKEQIAAGVMTDTNKKTTVEPIPEQIGVMKKYIPSSDSYGTQTAGATYTWDKVTSLRFQLVHDRYYPFEQLRSYDQIRTTGYDYTAASIRTTADGDDLAAVSAVKGNNWVDLNTMSAADKAKLEVGKTYYLRLTDKEIWDNYYGRHEVNYSDDKLVKIKIVEPDYTMPSTSVDFEWQNSANQYNKNQITLTPDVTKLESLVRGGTISRYTGAFYYTDYNGASVNYSTVKPYTTTSFYHGISKVTYTATLYKGDKKLGTVSKERSVVCFPDMTTTATVTNYNKVNIPASASDKNVLLSVTPNSSAGLFWAKDDNKISGTGTEKSVDLSDPANCGFYRIGYTLNGNSYFSQQGFYLKTQIGSVAVTGVVEPAAGNSPVFYAAAPSGKGYQIDEYDTSYWKEGVLWYNATDQKFMQPSDTFMGGKQYIIRIRLISTNDNCTFADTVTGTVNGISVPVEVMNSKKDIMLSRTFTCPKVLSTVNVTGSPKATIGKSAASCSPKIYVKTTDATQTEIIDSKWQTGKSVSGSIQYTDFDGTFAAGTTYYPLYTISPVGDNSFPANVTVILTDDNYSSYVARNSDGTLTMRGPGVKPTAVTKINPIAVNVTAPSAGYAPVFSASVPSGSGYRVGEDYTGTGFSNGVYWYNDTDKKVMKSTDVFAANKKYLVKVDVQALPGYEFDTNNILKGTVNGSNATVISPSGDISATHNYVQYTFTCPAGATYTISGTATSYLDNTVGATLMLFRNSAGIEVFTGYTVAASSGGSYQFSNVTAGTYRLTAVKNNHVPRDYTFTVSGNTTQDVKICPTGDANLNGKVQSNDALMVYKHAQGVNASDKITDPYAVLCADVTGNSKIQSNDALKIYQQAQGKHTLF